CAKGEPFYYDTGRFDSW
nr:immunoglobulin heavy chain junction region [Macaca mulatta]MOY22624.1 immunoglobulin heavy chain junction region [Macaca mulatta]MOY28445.1 immunoglobulin heavy chain junction region [Macaca mulatta]